MSALTGQYDHLNASPGAWARSHDEIGSLVGDGKHRRVCIPARE